MDRGRVLELIDDLNKDINGLEEALLPFADNALTTSTTKLPVLDRAKACVLMVYSIESILFSHVRLTGGNVKQHPIFTELARVKQYFTKLKDAETGDQGPSRRLDKEAAKRFIKHALASNTIRADRVAQSDPSASDMIRKRDRDEQTDDISDRPVPQTSTEDASINGRKSDVGTRKADDSNESSHKRRKKSKRSKRATDS